MTMITLEQGETTNDEGELVPALGFEFNGMFIVDPRLSECGRFVVDPVEAYGLTAEQIAALDADAAARA